MTMSKPACHSAAKSFICGMPLVAKPSSISRKLRMWFNGLKGIQNLWPDADCPWHDYELRLLNCPGVSSSLSRAKSASNSAAIQFASFSRQKTVASCARMPRETLEQLRC
jgi:hypothetical protein